MKSPHTLGAERAREVGGGTGTWRRPKGEEVAGPGEQLLVLSEGGGLVLHDPFQMCDWNSVEGRALATIGSYVML